MIKFGNTKVLGWEATIRGMRNPMNSWDKSDSVDCNYPIAVRELCRNCSQKDQATKGCYCIGENDLKLMKNLRKAGTDHRKFMRMITVYVDITAPLYWWKEFDTYKVGTVVNSCSTMHKITEKEFTLDDFSCEHLLQSETTCMLPYTASHCAPVNDGRVQWTPMVQLTSNIQMLNYYRDMYLELSKISDEDFKEHPIADKLPKGLDLVKAKKILWWQLIQLLPSSYNQKRTVQLNYEVLANIYKSRKNHKLDEWSVGFMDWIRKLPYSELITGEFEEC